MDLTDVKYEKVGRLATITLDRPDARNAYSDAMIEGLVRALDAAEADPELRAIVLTGAGPAFCAGGDLKRMREQSGMFSGSSVDLRQRYTTGIQRIPRRLAACEKPVVAAINGPAIGAGLDLACMCDIRIAVRSAKFGSTFARVGLIPGDGGAHLLSRVVGMPRALELILTARVIDAQEAEQIGLVQEVVGGAELLDAAVAKAEQIAQNAPLAVKLAKSAVYRSFDADLETALNLAATYQGILQRTEDHQEAVRAILDKRDPEFKGR